MDTLTLPWHQGAMDSDDASVAAVFCLQLPNTSKQYVNRSLRHQWDGKAEKTTGGVGSWG